MAITYDEVYCFDIAKDSIKDIISAQENFTSANNHILNTLLIKLCVSFFGHHLWVMRLPNVIAFAFYYLAVLKIARHLSSGFIASLSLVILANTIPYVLDFFSVARGYGLAMSLQAMSLAFAISYLNRDTENSKRSWALAFVFAALSVWANFTWFNFYVALWVAMNLVWFAKNKSGLNYKKWFGYNLIPLIIFIATLMAAMPALKFLSKANEFQWGTNGWWDSFNIFIRNFNYSGHFIMSVIIEVLLTILFVAVAVIAIKRKFQVSNLLLLSLFTISVIIVATVVQRNLLDILYMEGRKSLMFYLLLSIFLVAVIENLLSPKWKNVSLLVLVIFQMSAWTRWDFWVTREWYFEKYEALSSQLMATNKVEGRSGVNVNFAFSSSILYYNKYVYQNQLAPISRMDQSNFNAKPAYYYLYESEENKVPKNYKKKWKLGDAAIWQWDGEE